MRWLEQMNENIKRGIRSWLNVIPASPYNIQINELLDFETSAIRNRIWYRGDSNELEQLYREVHDCADQYKFWASKCTPGLEMRKVHTGLPGLIVRTLAAITMADMNDFDFDSDQQEQLWESIAQANDFRKKMEKALKEILCIGDGGSVFDGKLDSFDALDEVWSQWMDALRAGRAKTYIPECLVPKNPETGAPLKANSFDCRFFAGDNDMSEKAENKIQTDQPTIPHDSYLASYVTALDLCLQGIISPSTLGIDVKKLDNAEAQREKEKTTLYTRNAIVEALQEKLPKLVSAAINAYNILLKNPIEEVKVDIPFGEYANPSFESQVETMAKARPGVALMSVEAQVEELYGDSRDDQWKQEEIARLKAEQGITEVEEPGVNMAAGLFNVNLGGEGNAGEGNEPGLPNEPEGVSGAAGNSQ